MNPIVALVVIAGLVVVATLLGALWRVRTGRIRQASGPRVTPEALGPGITLGSDATIVQFSTEYCGPCRVAERLLTTVADSRPGVDYIDVDLGRRPHLASEFGVVQTPTILLLDAAGGIRSRIGGVPRAAEVAQRLDQIVKENNVVR